MLKNATWGRGQPAYFQIYLYIYVQAMF